MWLETRVCSQSLCWRKEPKYPAPIISFMIKSLIRWLKINFKLTPPKLLQEMAERMQSYSTSTLHPKEGQMTRDVSILRSAGGKSCAHHSALPFQPGPQSC